MKLKNYSAVVPVDRSISAIENLLVSAGASHIAKTYSSGVVDGIYFQIFHNGTPFTFKLPAKVDECRGVLESQLRMSSVRAKEQAPRTAWRLLWDWVAVQISLLQLQQAEPLEIFLPYAWDGSDTFYGRLKSEGFKMLPSGVDNK